MTTKEITMTTETRPSMEATGTQVPAGHWTIRVQALHAEGADDYTFESLAVQMASTLGWYPAATLASTIGKLADVALFTTTAMDTIRFEEVYLRDKPSREHIDLYVELGWSQSVLLAGWFRSLENMRLWRDWDRTD